MSSSRHLAAIMFTDIVGYTALMGKDEQRAFELLNKNRQIQKPIIEQYNGRWIKELGDGVMASFSTVSDAVAAAIKIQQQCNALKDFQLRIGIHLGEVVFENDDVFGDGVNVASRIQTIAKPGSIFISEAVHNSISNKKDFETSYFKEERLKNVKQPIKIYQVVADRVVTAPAPPITEKIKKHKITAVISLVLLIFMAAIYFYTTSKKTGDFNEKSIAILPFDDMSPGKNQEYLSDGLAEEIINSITILKDLKVIGRTSSFQYKGKGLDARTIGEKLNVSNVLGGSIQISGNILRITTTLISVKDNKVIWSQRFDKHPKDIFAIQDTIAKNIVDNLRITLSETERPRLVKKEIDPDVYALYLKGLHTYKDYKFDQSIEYNKQAIGLDSSFAPPYAYLALARTWKIVNANAFTDFNAISLAKENALTSIRLDPYLSEGYSALALLAWAVEIDFAMAKANFEKSIQLNPSASLIKNRYGYFLLWMADFDKAEKMGLDAIESDPADFNGYVIVSNAYNFKKRFDDAEKYITEGRKLFPDIFSFTNLEIQNKLYSGKYDQVIQLVRSILEKDTSRSREGMLSMLSVCYYKKGNLAESNHLLNLIRQMPSTPNSNIEYNMARVFAQQQKKDSCLARLERSYARREPDFKLLKCDPLLDFVKTDSRYKDLYRKYGFDRYK